MSEPLFSHFPMVIAAPARAFFHLVLTPQDDRHKLSFSVKDEANIRYYLIEGSHDMVSFDPLSRIYARGTSDLPRTYTATIHETAYSYYRIRQVDAANAALFSTAIPVDVPEERNIASKGGEDGDYDTQLMAPTVYAW